MSDSDRYIRSSSGLWTLNEPSRPPASGGPHARGLPVTPRERADSLAELGRADLAKGNLVGAETNFRLAVTYAPYDPHLKAELKHAVEAREVARKQASAVKK